MRPETFIQVFIVADGPIGYYFLQSPVRGAYDWLSAPFDLQCNARARDSESFLSIPWGQDVGRASSSNVKTTVLSHTVHGSSVSKRDEVAVGVAMETSVFTGSPPIKLSETPGMRRAWWRECQMPYHTRPPLTAVICLLVER